MSINILNPNLSPIERILDILSYDHYIIGFSGGKDCTAAVLHLLDLGVSREKIELWHHCIDGEPGSKSFMDWECTEDYCRKFAQAFGIKIYFSWKEGGFEGEMLRENTLTRPTSFEEPLPFNIQGQQAVQIVTKGGTRGKHSTRLKFPQVSPDLKVRWCSAYLKRDVFEFSINNQKRFHHKRTLCVTGERAEESTSRAGYKYFEIARTNRSYSKMKRHVDHLRPVHGWKESDVWSIIQRYGVVVHPCYYLGFARCSCKFCIFGNANQFATAYQISPGNGQKISYYERRFKTTIKRNEAIDKLIQRGVPYKGIYLYPELVQQAISREYKLQIFTKNWRLPLGAYGESAGPT